MTYASVLVLDLNPSVELEYLAEGGANVVYRMRISSNVSTTPSALDPTSGGKTPQPTQLSALGISPLFHGKLLRLRKDLRSTVPVLESQKYFNTTIQPLFTQQNLVEQLLFKPSASVIKSCNANLKRMETDGSRPQKRHGVFLVESESYGTLITDMTCAPTDSYASIEFKPKWLVQSPSAPAGSIRCRTCALRAMESVTQVHSSDPAENSKPGFCPLNLVSDDKTKVAAVAKIVLELCRPEESNNENLKRGLVEFLYKSPLLRLLRALQKEMDPVGVVQADPSHRNFLTAMTIRDCTLFLKVNLPDEIPCGKLLFINCGSGLFQIPRSGHGAAEARLGDLDLKTSSGSKAEYWRSVERNLIDNGWYTTTERSMDARKISCLLTGGFGAGG